MRASSACKCRMYRGRGQLSETGGAGLGCKTFSVLDTGCGSCCTAAHSESCTRSAHRILRGRCFSRSCAKGEVIDSLLEVTSPSRSAGLVHGLAARSRRPSSTLSSPSTARSMLVIISVSTQAWRATQRCYGLDSLCTSQTLWLHIPGPLSGR